MKRQLSTSQGYTSGGSPIAAEQLAFGYDPGWNMTNRSVNGTATTYAVNDLNEVTGNGSTSFYYDQNGNRTNHTTLGLKYTYDDENRLTMVSDDTYHTYRTSFAYDGLGRLRQRIDYVWTTGESPRGMLPAGGGAYWDPYTFTRYIYDGNRAIQERNNLNTPQVGYTRGKDLSGSLEGAGGIGGLLARSTWSGTTWMGHSYYQADGNGNITYLANSSQSMVAQYKYDPYGRTISSSGTLAAANLYRFSSKEIHAETGMYYYLYRFYDPQVARWLNRDPLLETGGWNLYEYARNRPTSTIDPLGLEVTGIDVVLTIACGALCSEMGVTGPGYAACVAACIYALEHPDKVKYVLPPLNYQRYDPPIVCRNAPPNSVPGPTLPPPPPIATPPPVIYPIDHYPPGPPIQRRPPFPLLK